MKRNTIVITTVTVLLFVIVGSFLLLYPFGKNQNGSMQQTVNPTQRPYVDNRPTLAPGTQFMPTPGIERKTYHNSKEGYTLQVPAEWKTSEQQDTETGGTILAAYYKYRTGPDTRAFDLTCEPNPKGLNSEEWVNQGSTTDIQPIGYVTFPNGTRAFVSIGQGQDKYKMFTMTDGKKVCDLGAYIYADFVTTNVDAIIGVVNSFQWDKK